MSVEVVGWATEAHYASGRTKWREFAREAEAREWYEYLSRLPEADWVRLIKKTSIIRYDLEEFWPPEADDE